MLLSAYVVLLLKNEPHNQHELLLWLNHCSISTAVTANINPHTHSSTSASISSPQLTRSFMLPILHCIKFQGIQT